MCCNFCTFSNFYHKQKEKKQQDVSGLVIARTLKKNISVKDNNESKGTGNQHN